MKKSQIYCLICFIFLPVLSIILLSQCMDMPCETIIEELLVAILTGCVLAIPSTIIGLIKNKNSIDNDLHRMIYRTKQFVSNLTFNSNETIQSNKKVIIELHDAIEKVLSKNIIKDVDKIETINVCLFRLSLVLSALSESFSHQSNTPKDQNFYNECINTINDLKKRILSQIESLDFDV